MAVVAHLLALLAGCSRVDFEATAELSSDFGTVATVRWTTETAGTSWVEYGRTNDLGWSTVVSDSETTEHEVLLVGMPPSTPVHWKAFSEVDGEVEQSAIDVLDSGPVDRETPGVNPASEKMNPSAAVGGFVTTTTVLQPSYVLLLNDEGKTVWSMPAGDDLITAQARPSTDGTSFLYNVANSDFAIDSSAILRRSYDGTILSETLTPWGHHDFVELPDGKFAYLAIDVREWEETPVVGDSIVEIEEGATEGTTIWSSWDTLPVDVDLSTIDEDIYPQGADWTHANNLVYDEADDAYLVSIHNTAMIVKVARSTGEIIWQLGGEGESFTRLDDGRPFADQHGPELTEEGLRLFDNGDLEGDDTYSQAVEFRLDETEMTYELTWSYDHEERNKTYLLGDHDGLPNGNHLIAWGIAGIITEVTDDGEVVWQIGTDAGNPVGFTHHVAAVGGAQ